MSVRLEARLRKVEADPRLGGGGDGRVHVRWADGTPACDPACDCWDLPEPQDERLDMYTIRLTWEGLT